MTIRRKILMGLCLTLATSLSSGQQQDKVWRIGILDMRLPSGVMDPELIGGFMMGLRDLGYIEGKNIVADFRFAEGHYERLPALAAELVRNKPDVIVTYTTPAARALRQATTTIPIVMMSVADPVGNGLAASLARPGGNLTGLANPVEDVAPKYLELLLAALSRKPSRVAVLVNPANPAFTVSGLPGIRAAAQRTHTTIVPMDAATPEDIDRAFSVMSKERIGGVIVGIDAFLLQQRRQIVDLAIRYRIASMFPYREGVTAGGLLSYARDNPFYLRRAAVYVDKILKGANPGDLPIEQPIRFYLLINRTTARTLRLTIPQEILLRADEVIE